MRRISTNVERRPAGQGDTPDFGTAQARCEDRIRGAKDTGAAELPLKGFAHNQVRYKIVVLACELLAYTGKPLLGAQAAAAAHLRRWGRLIGSGRRPRLRLARTWLWAGEVTTAITGLRAIASG